MIRLTDRILSFTWNRLYRVSASITPGAFASWPDGSQTEYVPCHRSHGLPAALTCCITGGWVRAYRRRDQPELLAGRAVFRHLRAFFIRRTFKGNKLYSTVFREYLSELFSRGYSVEYFVEGGRSRTGRLLDPKTGTLSMTIQAMLRGGTHPITLIPIYIGYEHVMEVSTYPPKLRCDEREREPAADAAWFKQAA